jgi:hypothetical protein
VTEGLAALVGEVDQGRTETENELRRELRELATAGLNREAIGLTMTAFGTLIAAIG